MKVVHTDVASTPTDRVDGGAKKWEYFPHDDRILVEQMDVEDTSQGGIIISTGGEKAFMGTVIRCGPGKRDKGERIPMTVCEGDIVVFGKYAGMETKLNDDKLMVMKEDDIIAIAVEVVPRCSECGNEAGHKIGCSLTPEEWREGQSDD